MEALKRRLDLLLSVAAIITTIIISIYYIDLEIKRIYSETIKRSFPLTRIKLYIFLLKPMLILVPFLLILTIFGFYFINRNRLRVIVVPSSEINELEIDKDILSSNERLVLETLFKNSGRVLQIDLRQQTSLKPWQISRILKRFESLGWIIKKQMGITNLIYLKLKRIN